MRTRAPAAGWGPTRRTISRVDALLRRAYGTPEARPTGDLLGGLVGTILSQHTSAANSRRAYANLRRRFPQWEAVARASEAAIAEAIAVGGLARIKSKWIRQLAANLSGAPGRTWLGDLERMPVEEAMAQLRALPGVGLKTAACVLLFDLGKPIFPVDTHVHRIARRMGWAPPEASAEATFAVLDPLVPPGIKHSLHVNLVRHGREVCLARRPRCAICPLEGSCAKVGVGTII